MHKLGGCEACVLDGSSVSRGCPYGCAQVHERVPVWVVRVGVDRYVLVECRCDVGRRVVGDERGRFSLLGEVECEWMRLRATYL